MKKADRIIISRTDSIGDVVLTLPLAGKLKEVFPDATLIFLGRNYTRDVIALSNHIDEFVSWDDTKDLAEEEKIRFLQAVGADVIIHVYPQAETAKISAKAKIPQRIGSTGRLYNYRYCNKLVPLSRKNAKLHESQLNFKLLKPLIGKVDIPSLDEMQNYYGFDLKSKPDKTILSLLDKNKFNLILHPKSKGSAREWPLEKYTELINILPPERFAIYISGTAEEGLLLNDFLKDNNNKVTDLTGKFTLDEFISFIGSADGLLAASTGPLHLAAALGKLAVGIYPPIKPMDPGRWSPVGSNAQVVVKDKVCSDCRKSLHCICINEISARQVANIILENV